MRSASLSRVKWVGKLCQPGCMCGWKGEPVPTLKAAKDHFRVHLADECPIGIRTPLV